VPPGSGNIAGPSGATVWQRRFVGTLRTWRPPVVCRRSRWAREARLPTKRFARSTDAGAADALGERPTLATFALESRTWPCSIFCRRYETWAPSFACSKPELYAERILHLRQHLRDLDWGDQLHVGRAEYRYGYAGLNLNLQAIANCFGRMQRRGSKGLDDLATWETKLLPFRRPAAAPTERRDLQCRPNATAGGRCGSCVLLRRWRVRV